MKREKRDRGGIRKKENETGRLLNSNFKYRGPLTPGYYPLTTNYVQLLNAFKTFNILKLCSTKTFKGLSNTTKNI